MTKDVQFICKNCRREVYAVKEGHRISDTQKASRILMELTGLCDKCVRYWPFVPFTNDIPITKLK